MPQLAVAPAQQPAQDPAAWGRLKRDLKHGFCHFADALVDPVAAAVPVMEVLGMACVAHQGARDPIWLLRAVRSDAQLGHYELCGGLDTARRRELGDVFAAAVCRSALS
jgi:hypothetical protein